MPQFMPQFPPQRQQNPPDQLPWQGQPSQPLPPSQPSGPWQQPNTGYRSAPQYPPQQQQPMQSGMYPPPQQPKKKSRRSLWIVLGVIVVLLLVFGGIAAAVNSGAKSADTVAATQVTNTQVPITTTTTTQSQPTTVSGNQHFKVGQVVKVNAIWQVTINSVNSMNGDTFSTPTVGNTYFIVDVTLKNLSRQAQNVSSALNFSLQDTTGQKYTETILIGETPPDGKVAASSLMHGQLTYEVPISQNSFTFNFEPDLIAGTQTVWDLQK